MRGVEERQSWSKEAIKCLLDVCIDEINKVGRNGGSLHKDSWVKLSIALKEKFGMDVNQKQMKNAFDTLKAKYVGWVYLRNKTGNIYNPHTNMFTLTTQEWEAFKKGHPRAASLRTQPLPYPDLCALFYLNWVQGHQILTHHFHCLLRVCAYGVLKARFPILKRMAPFQLVTQRNITIACFALHNFIRKEGLSDELFSQYDSTNIQPENDNVEADIDYGNEDEDEEVQQHGSVADRQYMTNLRDQIAQQLMQNVENIV